jgi:hypothetical protein
VTTTWPDRVAALAAWAWYKLDEVSGLPQDSSGNARHMTVASGTITRDLASLIPGDSAGKSVKKADGSNFTGLALPMDFGNASAGLTFIMTAKHEAGVSESIKFYRYGGSLTPAVTPAGNLIFNGPLATAHAGAVCCDGNPHLFILSIGGVGSGVPYGGISTSVVARAWVDGVVSNVTGPAPYAGPQSIVFDVGTASASGVHTGYYDDIVVLTRMVTDAEAAALWDAWRGIVPSAADVIVGGVKKPVVSQSVIVGGVKKPVVRQWVIVGGVKKTVV